MAKVISVLGLVPGSGSTFISTNIAAYLASEGENTLLVDLSVRGVLGDLFLVEAAREQVHPTIETWREFESPVESLLRTSYGLAILPGQISIEGRQEVPGACVNEILEYFVPMFDVIVIDVGGDLYLPHIRPALEAADVNLFIAEPTQRCIQSLPDHQKAELTRYQNIRLVVNKVGSYYHPRDIARWLGMDKYIAVPEEPARLNEVIKKRIPLALYGKGKACASLKIIAKEALNIELGDKAAKPFKEDSKNEQAKNPSGYRVENPTTSAEVAEKKVLKTGHGHNKLSVILGLGNTELENWFEITFSNDVEVICTIEGFDDFKQKLNEGKFEIAVLMRPGPMGGVPAADVIAEWAVHRVPAVLYIAGETDQEGSEIILRLKAAGVKHIISCPVGGFISGEELVFTMHNILREMRHANRDDDRLGDKPNTERMGRARVDTLQAFKHNAAKLSQVLKRTTGKPGEKKIKIKNRDEGVAFDEKPFTEIYNENIKNPTAIVQGGVLAVVSPWRPGLAGRLAAQAVKLFSEVEGGEVAYIGASAHSTGALWLDMPDEELMMSDWRLPGSQCPIKKDNLTIYAVDPAKDLSPESENETWAILKEARKTVTYTVMDLGGDMDMALKAAHQGRVVILVILPGADPVELKVSQLWLRNLQEGNKNIVVGIDLRGCPPVMPEGVKPKVVVRNNPADALAMALRRTQDDEFVWN